MQRCACSHCSYARRCCSRSLSSESKDSRQQREKTVKWSEAKKVQRKVDRLDTCRRAFGVKQTVRGDKLILSLIASN